MLASITRPHYFLSDDPAEPPEFAASVAHEGMIMLGRISQTLAQVAFRKFKAFCAAKALPPLPADIEDICQFQGYWRFKDVKDLTYQEAYSQCFTSTQIFEFGALAHRIGLGMRIARGPLVPLEHVTDDELRRSLPAISNPTTIDAAFTKLKTRLAFVLQWHEEEFEKRGGDGGP